MRLDVLEADTLVRVGWVDVWAAETSSMQKN